MSQLERKEIIDLLRLQGAERQRLFAEAQAIRHRNFGPNAVVRGVIEVTSVCIQNCTYCPMRRDNKITRYTYRAEDIARLARNIRDAGLRVVSLQGGDTPRTTQVVGEALPLLLEIFDRDVDILLVLGDKTRDEYAYLRSQGATSYILKHETSDPLLHSQHRFNSLTERLARLRTLIELGFRVGSGTIVGLPGQTIDMLADDILLAQSLGVHMCSASPFVPASGTPLTDAAPGDIDLTLSVIAVMRLVLPNVLIPSVSALDKQSPGAQLNGLNAGANVITVNFTAEQDQKNYPIYGQDRFIVRKQHATQILREAGLRSSLKTASHNSSNAALDMGPSICNS